MSFGNEPPDVLADAVEKLLAKIDETDLAAFYERELPAMPRDVVQSFVEAIFTAFRERGESSEDAAEESGTTLEAIERGERGAVGALLAYARTNADLIKEATILLVERRPDSIGALPAFVRDGLAARHGV